MSEPVNDEFNFEEHRGNVVSEYVRLRPLYEGFSIALHTILLKSLEIKSIKYHSIEARAKEVESFGDKAIKPSVEDPNAPKYSNPLKEITDLTAVRIITFFPLTVEKVDNIIYEEFEVLEKNNKGELLEEEEKLGYQSVHYLVRLKRSRCELSEYQRFSGLIAEIQVRTILQHAWAEIEHDIEYKSSITIPSAIRRRFMALAGLLEIADREFQSIQNDNDLIKIQSRKSVQIGKLKEVEITPDALKAYLDKSLGSDGRMTEFSYDWEVRKLIKMGFKNLKQIDDCIGKYDDNQLCGLFWNKRQGQLTRFEVLLIAGMGENFVKRHPWCGPNDKDSKYWINSYQQKLSKITKSGVVMGNYDPV